MSSENLHEQQSALKPETLERHRAIVSLMEELDAVDWYAQRVDASQDEALRRVLAHNRDEEKEHAVMLLEWLRRRDPKLDEFLRGYLFTDKDITEIEEDLESEDENGGNGGANGNGAGDGSLGIGSLRGVP